MTQSGERALEAFENTGTAADGALSKVSRTAAQTAKSTDAAADSVDGLSSAIGDYEKATGQAANSTGVLSEKTTETEKNLDEAAEAARKASDEVEKFGDKSEETGKQSEESSKKSRDGIKELQGVLASAGIAATLNEIKNGFFDCSEAAAQFETSTAIPDHLHGGRYHQCEESRYLDKEGHGRKIPGDEVAHVGTRTCRKTPGRSGTETADRTGCRPESRPLPGTVNAQRATALHKGCGLFV